MPIRLGYLDQTEEFDGQLIFRADGKSRIFRPDGKFQYIRPNP